MTVYKEEAIQIGQTFIQRLAFYWNLVKSRFREHWILQQSSGSWILDRLRLLLGSDHPAVSLLAMVLVSWYLLRDRQQRLAIGQSAISLFKLLLSPY